VSGIVGVRLWQNETAGYKATAAAAIVRLDSGYAPYCSFLSCYRGESSALLLGGRAAIGAARGGQDAYSAAAWSAFKMLSPRPSCHTTEKGLIDGMRVVDFLSGPLPARVRVVQSRRTVLRSVWRCFYCYRDHWTIPHECGRGSRRSPCGLSRC
jgi:hypothetical protein